MEILNIGLCIVMIELIILQLTHIDIYYRPIQNLEEKDFGKTVHTKTWWIIFW